MWEGVDEGSRLCQTSGRDNGDKSIDSGISKLTITSGVRSETQCENISPTELSSVFSTEILIICAYNNWFVFNIEIHLRLNTTTN